MLKGIRIVWLVMPILVALVIVIVAVPRVLDAGEIFVLAWPLIGSETALYFSWESLWIARG